MNNLIKGLLVYYIHSIFTYLYTAEFYTQRSQDIELQHRLSGLLLWWVSFSEELLFQFVVASFHIHQLLVSPSLFNFATTYNNDLICVLNGLQPVSDHQEGLVGDAREGLLNLYKSIHKYL